eukprot:1226791-Prymnesium_polylepis.1
MGKYSKRRSGDSDERWTEIGSIGESQRAAGRCSPPPPCGIQGGNVPPIESFMAEAPSTPTFEALQWPLSSALRRRAGSGRLRRPRASRRARTSSCCSSSPSTDKNALTTARRLGILARSHRRGQRSLAYGVR